MQFTLEMSILDFFSKVVNELQGLYDYGWIK